jgi:hypothetical protein
VATQLYLTSNGMLFPCFDQMTINLTNNAVSFAPVFGAGEMSPCVLLPATDECPVTQVYSLLPTPKILTLHLSRPDAVAVCWVVGAAIFDVTKVD